MFNALSPPFWLPILCYCYSLPFKVPARAIKELAMEAIRSEMNKWFVGHCGKDGDRTDRDIITTKLFLVNIWFGAGKGAKKKNTAQWSSSTHNLLSKNVAKAAVKRADLNFGTSFNCVRCQFRKLFISRTNQMWYNWKNYKCALATFLMRTTKYKTITKFQFKNI